MSSSRIPVLRTRSRSVPPVSASDGAETPALSPAEPHAVFLSEQHVAAMDKLVSLVEQLQLTATAQDARLVAMEERISRVGLAPATPRAGGCCAKPSRGSVCGGSLNKPKPFYVLAGGVQYAVCSSHKTAKVVLKPDGNEVAVEVAKSLA